MVSKKRPFSSGRGEWPLYSQRGSSSAIILGLVILCSSIANGFTHNRGPHEPLRRESRRLRSGHLNFNPFHVPSYNNHMVLGVSHNQDPQLILRPRARSPPPNHHNQNNDLSTSAQTLYDLRGFHIPLGGQEETQRYLRNQQQQNNHLDHHQTTSPLVFPSFFQPQHESSSPPQAINIFGHNQHHQQTQQRFKADVPPSNTFRPSQPDLGVTTTTEGVFRPVQPPQPIEIHVQEQRPRPRPDNPATNVEEVYVYDDTDYELEPPHEQKPEVKINQINTLSPTPIPLDGDGNEQGQEPQRFKLRELPPRTIQHNHRFLTQEQPRFEIFDSPNANDITSPPASAAPRPFVEIVPSSERKAPEVDVIDTLSPNRDIYQNQKSRFPPRLSSRPQAQPPTAQAPIVVEQQFPNYEEPPSGRIFPQNLQEERPISVIGYEDDRRQRQQPIAGTRERDRTRQQQQQFFDPQPQEVDDFSYQNDPIQIQKLGPIQNFQLQEPGRFFRGRPASNFVPPAEYEPRPTIYIEEKPEEIPPTTTTTPAPTTTTTSTTEAPTRKSTPEFKHIRPFSTRNRMPFPTFSTTTTAATTTAAAPKRRVAQPRPRPTTTEPTTLRPNIVEYEESEEIQAAPPTPFKPAPTKTNPTIRSRGSPFIRTRPTPTAVVVAQVLDEPKPQPRQRERKINFESRPPTPTPTREIQTIPNFEQQHPFRQRPVVLQVPQQHPRFQNEFPVFGNSRDFRNDFQRPEFVIQSELPPPRFNQGRQRPPSGKPLYISGKMLGKEGGVYAGHPIPFGHLYGSPVPLIPINTGFERLPPGGQVQVAVQQRRVPSPASIRQRQPQIPQTQRGNSAEENRSVALRPKIVVSKVHDQDDIPRPTAVQPKRIRPRPPALRRKIRPNPESQEIPSTQPPPPPRRVPSQVQVTANSETDPDIHQQIRSNEVSSAPPRANNPQPRRRKRPRVLKSNPQIQNPPSSSEVIESRPKIRPRIRPRQQRPGSLSIPQSPEPPTPIPQSSVQIFRKPTEAPGRFSSRYRDDNILPTPAPTQPSITISQPKPHKPQPESKSVTIKTGKIAKISGIDSSTPSSQASRPSPQPTSATVVPVHASTVAFKQKSKANPNQPKEPEDPDALPPSIFLTPKDVIANRKPARRIPPGSYSDRIKALQARRKNLKQRGPGPAVHIPAAAAKPRVVQPQRQQILDEEEDDDQEVYESSNSNIEQVQNQNKREIRNRHKFLNKEDSKAQDTESMENYTSTEATLEETMDVLGIRTHPKQKSMEKSQVDPTPTLVSLADEGEHDENDKSLEISPKSSEKPELVHFQPPINTNSFDFLSNANKAGSISSKSPFSLFTMSTEEPSLPLEAYFPIVSPPQ